MNKEIARQQSGWIIISDFPDVCKTPLGNSIVPVPYPVTAKLTHTKNVSPNVNAQGKPIFLFDKSMAVKTLGDQAGIAKGIKSNTVGGKCLPLKHSETVRCNRKYVVRHRDKIGMNG